MLITAQMRNAFACIMQTQRDQALEKQENQEKQEKQEKHEAIHIGINAKQVQDKQKPLIRVQN